MTFSQKEQGHSGGGVNILKGDSIGHCEKKNLYNMCLIMIDYRDRAKESTNTKPLLIVINKDKLLFFISSKIHFCSVVAVSQFQLKGK